MTPRLGLALAICGLLALTACKGRTPGKFETAMATEVKRRITVGGKSNRNPLPATAESIHTGQVNFSHYCMACHGLDGQNTGVPFAEKMSPPPPPLNSRQVQLYSDGQLKWVIENGLFPSGMPAARGILNEDEMWSIVNYIRHLPPKGSLGEPPAYSGDEPVSRSPSPVSRTSRP